MTEGQYQARLVCDSTGNLWHWYGDVGYVLLVTTSREQCAAASTLAELEARVGPVSEWASVKATRHRHEWTEHPPGTIGGASVWTCKCGLYSMGGDIWLGGVR